MLLAWLLILMDTTWLCFALLCSALIEERMDGRTDCCAQSSLAFVSRLNFWSNYLLVFLLLLLHSFFLFHHYHHYHHQSPPLSSSVIDSFHLVEPGVAVFGGVG